MPNTNEIRTGRTTNGEFTVSYQQNGYGGIIPVIDGTPHPELMMGYVSEKDRDAGLKLLSDALRATAGNIPAAMTYMYQACAVAANEIQPDEAVDVDGKEILICYGDRKAYDGTTEIANLADIGCELSNVAIKAMLIDRVRLAMAETTNTDEEDDDWIW